MMSLNKKSHIAVLCVPRVALAFLIFGAGGAFSAVQEVEIVAPNILKVSLEGSDTDVFVNTRVQNDVYVRPANEGFPWLVEVDMGGYGDLGAVLADIRQETGYIFGIRERVQQVLTNLVAHGQYLSHIEQYSQVTSENSTNLPAIKNALYYDGDGLHESVSDILADIRENTQNSGFALGNAFTNLAAALSYQISVNQGTTNYNNIADALLSDDGEFYSRYGLQPLYYNFIYGDLPFDRTYSPLEQPPPFGVSRSQWSKFFATRGQMFNVLRHHPNFNVISNQITSASDMRYHLYNTYQSRAMLSNLLYNANMLTWTNMEAAGISPDNFAMHWFDSYNTKFLNMLLEYGTLASITNENKTQVQFARNWYDSYSPRVILEYLVNSDFLNGTNSLSDTLEALDDKVDSYSLSKLPLFGMNTNSASIDMGVINATPDSGYKSVGDDIQDQDYNQASYLNDGWRIFDTIQDKYENAIDIIIGQIFEFDGGDSKAFRDGYEGGGNSDSVGLSLRVNPVRFRDPFTQQETTIISEDYIDFTLPSMAKDKLNDYWALIKAALEWGMWIWAFLYCWNLLAGSDTKQSSPTILD